jgi:integrase
VNNCKIVLSSIFSRALSLDLVQPNPLHRFALDPLRSRPTAAQDGDEDELDGPRFSIDEIEKFLSHLSGRDKTIVATMFYAALRPGECAALQWSDYDGVTLNIRRAVYDGVVDTPKTGHGSATAPEPLRQILDAHKGELESSGHTTASWMFPGATGAPVRLDSVAERIMKPLCPKLHIEWRGWYAMRRGATDYLLLTLGLEFDEVRAILRHDPRSRVLEKHYAALAAQRGVQKRTVVAIGKKIDAAFTQRALTEAAALQEQIRQTPAAAMS